MQEEAAEEEIVEAAPRVAAYTQMLEISNALATGVLTPETAAPLWDEVETWLMAEIARFEAYPSFEWPPYTEGLARVCGGLSRLLESVAAARLRGLDAAIQAAAEAGSDEVARGQALLVAACDEASRGDDLVDTPDGE